MSSYLALQFSTCQRCRPKLLLSFFTFGCNIVRYRKRVVFLPKRRSGDINESNRGRKFFFASCLWFSLKEPLFDRGRQIQHLGYFVYCFWKSRCKEPPLCKIRDQNRGQCNLLFPKFLWHVLVKWILKTGEMQHRTSVARGIGKISLFCFLPYKVFLKTAFRREYAILILYPLCVRVHYFCTCTTVKLPSQLFWLFNRRNTTVFWEKNLFFHFLTYRTALPIF